ncbi:hypothetical protein LP420_27495 [Massilia sp. B-10]|nr:hypothetical protein LP420_27495 [Massilia sp. B-10]
MQKSDAPGARNAISKSRQVPAIYLTMPDGSRHRVKFDGLDENGVLVDRKMAVVTTRKGKGQAVRQSQALAENGRTGRWEVPNEQAMRRAKAIFDEKKILNIDASVVPTA